MPVVTPDPVMEPEKLSDEITTGFTMTFKVEEKTGVETEDTKKLEIHSLSSSSQVPTESKPSEPATRVPAIQ